LQRPVLKPASSSIAFEVTGMNQRFDQAANDSPRSGSSKRMAPVVWGVIVVALVAIVFWFVMKP
jgi:hypothetical protein